MPCMRIKQQQGKTASHLFNVMDFMDHKQARASHAYPPTCVPSKRKLKALKGMTRREVAEYKVANNKFSDEYYTRTSWHRFIVDHNLVGQTVVDPFYGDGSFMDHMNDMVNVISTRKTFGMCWNVVNYQME